MLCKQRIEAFFKQHCSFDLRMLAKETVCHHSACFLWSPTCTTTVLSDWGGNHLSTTSPLFISSPLFLALASLATSPAAHTVFTFKSAVVLIQVQTRSAGNEKSPQSRPQPSVTEQAPLETQQTKVYRVCGLSNFSFDKTYWVGSGRSSSVATVPISLWRELLAPSTWRESVGTPHQIIFEHLQSPGAVPRTTCRAWLAGQQSQHWSQKLRVKCRTVKVYMGSSKTKYCRCV